MTPEDPKDVYDVIFPGEGMFTAWVKKLLREKRAHICSWGVEKGHPDNNLFKNDYSLQVKNRDTGKMGYSITLNGVAECVGYGYLFFKFPPDPELMTGCSFTEEW